MANIPATKPRAVSEGARRLRAFLATHALSVQRFCTLHRLDRIQVQRVLSGEITRISVDFAKSIREATNGAVGIESWSSDTLRPVEATLDDRPTTGG